VAMRFWSANFPQGQPSISSITMTVERAASRPATGAIVLGLHVNGLGVLHSLVRHDVPVIGLDDRPRQIGFRSRYGRKLVCPSPQRAADKLVEFMLELGRSIGSRWVLLPTNDEFTEFVSRHREALAPYFAFAVPTLETIGELFDKWRFYRLAQRHGVAAPVTACPRSAAELVVVCERMPFPCLLKPVVTTLWKGVSDAKAVEVRSASELHRRYQELSRGRGDLVIQEVIPGRDDLVYFYFAYYDGRGLPQSEFTARKIRQYPPQYGSTSLAESLWVPRVAELSRTLLQSIGYRGLVDVEFKKDPRDDCFKIIEINPRIGLQHQLAARVGADLPFTAYRHLNGDTNGVPGPRPLRDGVKWVILHRDVESARHYLARGQLTAREWLASLRGTEVLAVWNWRDPVPFFSLLGLRTVATAAHLLGRVIASGVRRLYLAARNVAVPRRSRPVASPRSASDRGALPQGSGPRSVICADGGAGTPRSGNPAPAQPSLDRDRGGW
jgi:D-aspartate ligase